MYAQVQEQARSKLGFCEMARSFCCIVGRSNFEERLSMVYFMPTESAPPLPTTDIDNWRKMIWSLA